jgi:hypothetical protein
MNETVDQGDDAGGVREDIGPFREGLVGGHECRAVLISAADQLEQQIGVAVGIGEITDLIDHQNVGSGVVAQASAQRGIAIEGGEFAKHLAGGFEQHSMALDERLVGDVLGKG